MLNVRIKINNNIQINIEKCLKQEHRISRTTEGEPQSAIIIRKYII